MEHGKSAGMRDGAVVLAENSEKRAENGRNLVVFGDFGTIFVNLQG
jgi:hypothetical protein